MMGFPFASVIGAGLSFAGKLFGGSSKAQTTSSTVDYVKLRDAAIKGGFNPLTALRAGGAAGFQVTHHPALSSANIFGRALDSFGGMLMNADFGAEKRAEQEMALLSAQIGLAQAQTKRIQSLDVPAVQGSRYVSGGGALRPGVLPPSAIQVEGPAGAFDVTNPDAPSEPEQDLWRWAREKRIVPKSAELLQDNFGDLWDMRTSPDRWGEIVGGMLREVFPKPQLSRPAPGWMDQQFGPMIPR